MSRLIILGIDALDKELVNKYLDKLTNIRKVINNGNNIKSTSTFPPDSDTAWATIYTGLNPANHGVVDFVDPLERKKIKYKTSTYVDLNLIKNKTFWDILGKYGIKSSVVFPHLVTKVWPINGSVVITDPNDDEIIFYPEQLKSSIKKGKIIGQKRIPKSKLELKNYVINKKKVVSEEFKIAEEVFEKTEWDVFFFYSSTLDSIMHIFWNYCDPEDPTYPGKNPFETTILDFHLLYDKLIGNFLSLLKDDDRLIILSDHGHYRRPTKIFNINEVLKKEGFLFEKGGSLKKVYSANEKFKRNLTNIAQKSGMRPLAQTLLRMFPFIKRFYTKPSNIDFEKTIAHCTDLSGLKAYTYGGIKVDRTKFDNDTQYYKTIDLIIEKLESYKIPNSNQNIFEWIKKREELYQGKYINKYPEIIFNLAEGYGAGWATGVPIFTESLAHKFYPGSHRATTPVFFLMNCKKEVAKKEMKLMDVTPTVLEMFDIQTEKYNFDGESIFKREK